VLCVSHDLSLTLNSSACWTFESSHIKASPAERRYHRRCVCARLPLPDWLTGAHLGRRRQQPDQGDIQRVANEPLSASSSSFLCCCCCLLLFRDPLDINPLPLPLSFSPPPPPSPLHTVCNRNVATTRRVNIGPRWRRSDYLSGSACYHGNGETKRVRSRAATSRAIMRRAV